MSFVVPRRQLGEFLQLEANRGGISLLKSAQFYVRCARFKLQRAPPSEAEIFFAAFASHSRRCLSHLTTALHCASSSGSWSPQRRRFDETAIDTCTIPHYYNYYYYIGQFSGGLSFRVISHSFKRSSSGAQAKCSRHHAKFHATL